MASPWSDQAQSARALVAVAPETLAAQDDPDAYIADVMKLIHQVNSEDHVIVEGLRASVHRPQFEGAPLSYLERNVWDFDQYIRNRLTSDRVAT